MPSNTRYHSQLVLGYDVFNISIEYLILAYYDVKKNINLDNEKVIYNKKI